MKRLETSASKGVIKKQDSLYTAGGTENWFIQCGKHGSF